MLCLVSLKKKRKKVKINQTYKVWKKKMLLKPTCVLTQAQVSVAHSHCLGSDSSGLTDLAGRVWRCTFSWREQTAAFLFCHLTFWWGDVSPSPGWPRERAREREREKQTDRQTDRSEDSVAEGGLGARVFEGFYWGSSHTQTTHDRLPAVSACTVTSQSYSVNPNIPAAFLKLRPL